MTKEDLEAEKAERRQIAIILITFFALAVVIWNIANPSSACYELIKYIGLHLPNVGPVLNIK